MLLTFTFECWALHKTFWLSVCHRYQYNIIRVEFICPPDPYFFLFTFDSIWSQLLAPSLLGPGLETQEEFWTLPSSFSEIINFGKIHLLNKLLSSPVTTNAFLGQDCIILDWRCEMTSLLIMSQSWLSEMNFHSISRMTSKIQSFVMAHEAPNLASTKLLQSLLPSPPKPSHSYSNQSSTNPHFHSQPSCYLLSRLCL